MGVVVVILLHLKAVIIPLSQWCFFTLSSTSVCIIYTVDY